MKKKTNILRLTESAVMIAFATVLSEIKITHLPFGGSITAFSMLPLIIIAYRYGTKWGLFSAGVAGIFQLLLGMNNLRYGTGLLAVATIILFDYIIAYGILGLGGIFRGKFGNQGIEMAAGAVFTLTLRYLCHVITGFTVWKQWAPSDRSLAAYAFGYNATYMVPEIIITAIGSALVCIFLDFTSKDITRKAKKESKSISNSLCAMTIKITGIFIAVTSTLYSTYGMINAFLENSDPSSSLLLIFVSGIAAGIIIYGFGELIQLCSNIYSKLSQEGIENKQQ